MATYQPKASGLGYTPAYQASGIPYATASITPAVLSGTPYEHAFPFVTMRPDLRMVLLKGENAVSEIENARKIYGFDVEISPSITDSEASILQVSNIKCA